MPSARPADPATAFPSRSAPVAGTVPDRVFLLGGTGLALLAAGTVALRAPAPAIDPDLVRVIRCMALIKGGFLAGALAACWWRLARPASGWRRLAYVAGPPLIAAGTVALWSLHGLGLAALCLHLGLFGVAGAALTDPRFLDGVGRGAP